jgi:TrwC relaxase
VQHEASGVLRFDHIGDSLQRRQVFLRLVMSIWKLRVGAENYYLAQVANGLEDYYSGRGEMPGRWVGAAASGLGLGVDAVDPGGLRAVLAGLQPGTGQSPNGGPPRNWTGRVPGFDLTFAVPKSVSVIYALGDPLVVADVVASVDRAVDEALAWLEREARFVRRGSNNRATASDGSAGRDPSAGGRRVRGRGVPASHQSCRRSPLTHPCAGGEPDPRP